MAAFAWPVCVCLALLIFGVFFVLRFQREIGRFIERTKRISRQGVDTDSTAIVSQEVGDVAKPSPTEGLLREFDNQLLVEQEGLITKHLQENKIDNPAERERVLTRYLAASYVLQRFESIYQTIWGSQLRSLQALNESGTGGIPLPGIEPWYELGRSVNPDWYTNYSFQDWYGFMEGVPLVINKAGTVHITVLGREFLKYLVDKGYPTTKRG